MIMAKVDRGHGKICKQCDYDWMGTCRKVGQCKVRVDGPQKPRSDKPFVVEVEHGERYLFKDRATAESQCIFEDVKEIYEIGELYEDEGDQK